MTQTPETEQSGGSGRLPQPGDVIAGKYRIERIIGKGGMGAVFAAQHEILLQPVALKVLLKEIADIPEARARFLNEARNALRIQSEHVARVLDVGDDRGMPYLVMEYLEGEDLGNVCNKRGPLPWQEVVDCVLEALEAIAQAHASSIIHRDLKPANLFLTKRQDGRPFVKVLDFGISKTTNPLSAGSGGMTSTKAMLGSPFYMSPEQLRSSKSVDARTDIWAIGVIMYELLTGNVPFNGDNLGELFAAILEQPPAPVRSLRADVPPELDQTVLRCLQRAPEQRFATARQLAVALSPFASPRGRLAADRIRASTPSIPPSPAVNPQAASVYSPGGQGAPPGQVQTGDYSRGSAVPQHTPPQMQQSAPGLIPQGSQGLPATAGAGTAASWGNTGGGAGAPRKGPLVALLAIGGAGALALAVVGGVLVMHSKHPSAAAPPSTVAAPATTAPPVDTASAVTPQIVPPKPAMPASDSVDAGVVLATAPPPAKAMPQSAPQRAGKSTPSTPPQTSAPARPPAAPAPSTPTSPPRSVDDIPGAGRK